MNIDMHCDTISRILMEERKGNPIELRKNDLHISLEKLKEGDYLAQCFAMFVFLGKEMKDPFGQCNALIDCYEEELKKNQDLILPAYTYEDVMKNHESGKLSGILTIEEGGVLAGKIENVEHFYQRGVRMICLNWNFNNGIGHPNFDFADKSTWIDGHPDFHTANTKDGLTDFGKDVVREMNRLGMIVDVSHLSDAGFYDVLEVSSKPFVASHSNARSVCPHVRNLTDDMILKLSQKGGITGINYCTEFVNEDAKFTYVKDLVKHINHIVQIGGIGCVGLGSDFDGIDDTLEFKNAAGVPMIIQTLKEEGYSQEEIDCMTHKNFLRVFQEVCG